MQKPRLEKTCCGPRRCEKSKYRLPTNRAANASGDLVYICLCSLSFLHFTLVKELPLPFSVAVAHLRQRDAPQYPLSSIDLGRGCAKGSASNHPSTPRIVTTEAAIASITCYYYYFHVASPPGLPTIFSFSSEIFYRWRPADQP